MSTLANVFALLADHETEDVSTIAGLDVKPKKNKDDNKKTNKPGRGKEGHQGHGQRSVGNNVVEQSYNGHQHNGRLNGYVNGSGNRQSYNGHQHNGRSNGFVNGSGNRRYGRGDEPVYKRSWQVNGNAGDGQANGSVLHNGPSDGLLKDGVHVASHHQDNNRPRKRRARVTEIGADQEFENDEVKASDGDSHKQEADNSPVVEEVKGSHHDNQEHKAVDHHQGNENQGKVSAETEVLSKEELRERTRLAKEQAEQKAKWLARQEEIKREMAMKTLKEYEEQKAIEKRKKAEKATLSVPQARTLDKDLESMLVLSKEKKDDIHTKQKSKNETIKKDGNIDKDAKVYKTMSIEEFMKLPTRSEGQGGPGSDRSEDSMKNTNGGGKGKGGAYRNYENSNHGGGRGRGGVIRNYENSKHGGGRGRGGVSRNDENSNHNGTRRGRSNSRDSRTYENDNRGGIGGGRVYTRNRAPDLSETSIFPDLGEATKPRKDLGN